MFESLRVHIIYLYFFRSLHSTQHSMIQIHLKYNKIYYNKFITNTTYKYFIFDVQLSILIVNIQFVAFHLLSLCPICLTLQLFQLYFSYICISIQFDVGDLIYHDHRLYPISLEKDERIREEGERRGRCERSNLKPL